MPRCSVNYCKNNTLKVQKKTVCRIFSILPLPANYAHIAFYRLLIKEKQNFKFRTGFPKHEIQREKWRAIIARDRKDEFYKPNDSSVIFSEHLCKDDMYLTEKGFRRIKKKALPNIQQKQLCFEDSGVASLAIRNLQSPSTSRNTPLNLDMIVKSEQFASDSNQMKEDSLIKSPSSSLGLQSMLDTPREFILRKKLRFCKKQLLSKNKKVKNLQKVNRRLKKKNASLKAAVTFVGKQRDLYASVLVRLSSHVEVPDTFN